MEPTDLQKSESSDYVASLQFSQITNSTAPMPPQQALVPNAVGPRKRTASEMVVLAGDVTAMAPPILDWTNVDGRATRYVDDAVSGQITPNPSKKGPPGTKKSRQQAQKEIRDLKVKGESKRFNKTKKYYEIWCSANQWCHSKLSVR